MGSREGTPQKCGNGHGAPSKKAIFISTLSMVGVNMPLFGKDKGIEVVLKVDGMTCGHCVQHVTSALKGLKGVKKVNVSLEKGSATVVLDQGGATREELIKAVEEAGYKAA